MTIIFSGFGYKPLGCFKDRYDPPTITRALELLEVNEKVNSILAGDYRSRADAIYKCYKAATFLGYQIFGVQNGGACMSSEKGPDNYKKYGKSNDCANDGKGGPWANAVYEITTGNLNLSVQFIGTAKSLETAIC